MTAGNATAGVKVHGNVYGGGNLADVGQTVTVNVSGGEIDGDVYGGGALANTNIGNVSGYGTESEVISSTSTYTTIVSLTGGIINGDAYGGGLGRAEVKAADAVGEPGDPGYKPAVEAVSPIEAKVYGDVLVTLNGTKIPGHVFGCNNINGTPKGHVKVHVLSTEDSDKSSETASKKERTARTPYDVAAVYGGGNQAEYLPVKAFDADANIKAQAFAEVLIEGCTSTSIESVYGGGNAAAVPATLVIIKGAYIINNVFGGGNGAGQGNPGANVGY